MNRFTHRRSFEGRLEAVVITAPEGAGEPMPPRATEFRPVQGGTETTSGGTLLIEAYAAIWVILLGFLLVSWRRQSRIDARVAELERSFAQLHGASK
jgi:CcmD family protein